MSSAKANHLNGSRDRIDSSLLRLQSRSQPAFYTAVGTIGSLVGLLIGGLAVAISQFALRTTEFVIKSESLTSALVTGLGLGIFASTLGTALFLGMRRYKRQAVERISVSAIAISGFLSGAICGGIAQLVVNGITDSHEGAGPIVITAASILVGTLLGIILSRNVTNLPPMRGLVAGLAAGLISGLTSAAAVGWGIAAAGSYLLGFAALGAALGFGMAIVDKHFRDAVIEVEWEPHETTRVGLGSKPIRIGGGRDHIVIAGAPPHLSSISIRDGEIEHVETATGKRTELKDGSRLRVGGLNMVVHTTSRPSASTGRQRQGH